MRIKKDRDDALAACHALVYAWELGAFEGSSKKAEELRGKALDLSREVIARAEENQ